MQRTGFSENLWPELLEDIRERRMTKLLRAWLPSAHKALLWNPRSEKMTCRVRFGSERREVMLQALESTVLADLCA